MARSDLERWNRKYRDGNPNPDFAPDPILIDHANLLDGVGTALDVACGVGHNAIHLARLGYDVMAVDGSLSGLRYCHTAVRDTSLRVHPVNADLEHFFLAPRRFDLVLAIRYLHRPLIPMLKDAVKPGGLVIYKTFNVNYLRERPVFDQNYLLNPGELVSLFSDFDPIATNDTPEVSEYLSFWIGRRPPARDQTAG